MDANRRKKQPAYAVYHCFGAAARPLLIQAQTDFYQRFGRAPAAIVCHPQWAAQIQAALDGRAEIPVATAGGCLVGEIWLQCQREGGS